MSETDDFTTGPDDLDTSSTPYAGMGDVAYDLEARFGPSDHFNPAAPEAEIVGSAEPLVPLSALNDVVENAVSEALAELREPDPVTEARAHRDDTLERQQGMFDLAQDTTQLSNIAKMRHDMEMDIINNMRT